MQSGRCISRMARMVIAFGIALLQNVPTTFWISSAIFLNQMYCLAAMSAKNAMDKYNGVKIDCEYLGALADEHVPEQHRQYVLNPFLWRELGPGDWSSRRQVYAKWAVHIPDGEHGDRTCQYTTSEYCANLLDLKRTFPEPIELHGTWAHIVMTQKARQYPHAHCVFDKIFTDEDGQHYAQFTWTGVYVDASRNVPHRSKPRLADMLRKGHRDIPDDPTEADSKSRLKDMLRKEHRDIPDDSTAADKAAADEVEDLHFTVDFYDKLALKLKMQFAGVVTLSGQSLHPWLEHKAPQQLDADCIWILESGRSICKPANEIVVRSKREQLFGINANQSLEEYADYFYCHKFQFKDKSSDDPFKNVDWVTQMATTSGRHQIACMKYGFFACLGVPNNRESFECGLKLRQRLQDEPWSTTTWASPGNDCEESYWVTNRPLKDAHVLPT